MCSLSLVLMGSLLLSGSRADNACPMAQRLVKTLPSLSRKTKPTLELTPDERHLNTAVIVINEVYTMITRYEVITPSGRVSRVYL